MTTSAPGRRFYQLAHDLVFKTPGARALVQRYGTVPASPQNMKRALERDAALLVYPGGDDETFRPSWESGTIDFADRTGFIKLALADDVPVVPVVSIGGQETALLLGRGRGAARVLSLDRLHVKVLPAVVGPPFGLAILDLPVRVPLPAKISSGCSNRLACARDSARTPASRTVTDWSRPRCSEC